MTTQTKRLIYEDGVGYFYPQTEDDWEIAFGMGLKCYRYNVLHIPTQTQLESGVVFTSSRARFLRLLNKWNESPAWKYWELR